MIIYAYCKKFTSKTNGNVFYSLSVKGEKIIEEAKKIEEDTKIYKNINKDDYYNIRLVGVIAPSKEGVYKIDFVEGWRDVREGFKDKKIYRIKNPSLSFYKSFEDCKKKEVKEVKQDNDLPF